MVTPVTIAQGAQALAQNASGIAQGLSNALSGAQSALGALANGSFWAQLRPASFRGVPFAVVSGGVRVGRRVAVHEYPKRDSVWPEDLGRHPRRLQVQGFVVGDDAIAQRERLVAACETQGAGELVHPTLGRLRVSALDVEFAEHRDKGRVFEVTFSFIEAGERVFPSAQTDTKSLVSLAAQNANLAAAADFVTKAVQALENGAAVAQAALSTATKWTSAALSAANDAASLVNMVAVLPGSFGRQAQALLSGFTSFQKSQPASSITVQTLEGQASSSRTQTATAAAAVTSSAGGLSPTTASAYPATVQALPQIVQQSAATPRDALRALIALAQPQALSTPPSGAIGAAMGDIQSAQGDLFRRAAVVALAQAASSYQPFSADDAATVRSSVTQLLDDEITTGGDEGDDDTYLALRALRAAVVQDLNTRGALMPSVVWVRTAASMPALALAQRLYRDPSRADELVAEADTAHPAFMPTAFRALAS
ncbi:MAG: DNA circularization N-terminal domain-containing protein [Betaproteobacteria bacterium]|nr:DNA circularization N-terminal domain-containing protein [Betaproteobacteria bacterium]